MRCIRCNYDLRATEHRGACPECGLPVSASSVELARLAEIDDPCVPSLRTALDLFAAGAVLALVTAPAALIGLAIVESVRQSGPKLGAPDEMQVLVTVTLAAIVVASTTALAAGFRLAFRVRPWTPDPSNERGLPGFVNVTLASVATVFVIFVIGWIAAASRGEESVAPIASTLWVALLPLRAPLLVHAGDYTVRVCRPRGATSARVLGRSIGRVLLTWLWIGAILIALAHALLDLSDYPALVFVAAALAGLASVLEIVVAAHLLGSVTAGGRAFRKARAEQRARRE
ncbi:MAG: hypothetical protein JNM94_09965 [Phycisphaerae bacterium]|nr:hypothetical protein [Phycisphaerae bacterium]